MKTLKTKKNTQKLEKKRLKQKIKNGVKQGVKNGIDTKQEKKRSLKYNKKGGGESEVYDNFNQEYESVDTNNGTIGENFEGEFRGLGDGLKISQPIGEGDKRQPMPEMPECCIL
jgi:hypothetical protein